MIWLVMVYQSKISFHENRSTASHPLGLGSQSESCRSEEEKLDLQFTLYTFLLDLISITWGLLAKVKLTSLNLPIASYKYVCYRKINIL